MDRHGLVFVVTVAICGGLVGCGSRSAPEGESNDSAIAELGESGKQSPDGVAAKSVKDSRFENLELRLKVGDRFPLMKTIEQRLIQTSANGGRPIESNSKLTLKLAIQVESIEDGVKRLGVRYQQVRYEHDVAGERVRYDSVVPEKVIPEAARVYQGLVDNGFSFVLTADNRIMQVVEFEEFLKRCVRHAPPAHQKEMLTRLVASTEDEGIANFVDDSIGILPYNIDSRNARGSVKIGDSWDKTRQIMRPIPMTMATRYRLTSSNDRYATIELLGQIVPATIEQIGAGVQQTTALEKVSLRSGHCFGTCEIDRDTGLPIQSRVVRHLDMSLELPSGAKFHQQKEITTTVQAYPQQRSDPTAQIPDTSNDRQNGPSAKSNAATPREPLIAPAGFQRAK